MCVCYSVSSPILPIDCATGVSNLHAKLLTYPVLLSLPAGLLWFKKRLPSYAAKFIELVLQISADHGPCVSGAHNTIVAARAGKDLISSLCSGLLTIGPR